MTDIEKAEMACLVRLVKHYRAIAEAAAPKPMDERRVKEILSIPDAELVTMLIKHANLTAQEEQAINYCYRLGYTQEAAADLLDKTRNTIYAWCRSGLAKLVRSWSGIFWLRNI